MWCAGMPPGWNRKREWDTYPEVKWERGSLGFLGTEIPFFILEKAVGGAGLPATNAIKHAKKTFLFGGVQA